MSCSLSLVPKTDALFCSSACAVSEKQHGVCPANLSSAPGNSFPGAGTQLPPAPGKPTHFSSIVNECDLSPAPGNSFPGARAQLSPAPGKPTHLSLLVERMLLVLKRSSKLGSRRRADLSPAPERKLRTHQRWETKSSRCLI